MPDIRVSVKATSMESFNSKAYVDRIAAAQVEKTVPAVKKLFEQTVEGWKEKPSFEYEKKITSTSIGVRIFASGPGADKYGLIVRGSPAHPIPAKSGGLLRFQPGYSASTKPRVLSSKAFQRSGAFVGSPGIPRHPGFEAREFDKVIAETHQPIFQADMQDAMKR